jgi:uncharacterized protein YoaH (UPF0181 family)
MYNKPINKPMMNTSAMNPSMQTSSAPNEQQMLAQALRGSGGMPQQQQFTEEEMMMIQQLMGRGMSQPEATAHVMQMRGRTSNAYG